MSNRKITKLCSQPYVNRVIILGGGVLQYTVRWKKQEYLKIIAMECVCNDVKFKREIHFQKD